VRKGLVSSESDQLGTAHRTRDALRAVPSSDPTSGSLFALYRLKPRLPLKAVSTVIAL
jgi:hypothetical protein